MANALYGKGREKFLSGDIAWDTDNIKVSLVDTGTYTVVIDTHEFYSDLSGVVADSGNLASKTVALGVADAADVTFSSVTGSSAEALVIWKDTGTASTSPLIAYIDTATNLPITPNGGDITVAWDSGANKIFKL
jgi:ApbE superfamily uncharacterized protein (UPF0280 family)